MIDAARTTTAFNGRQLLLGLGAFSLMLLGMAALVVLPLALVDGGWRSVSATLIIVAVIVGIFSTVGSLLLAGFYYFLGHRTGRGGVVHMIVAMLLASGALSLVFSMSGDESITLRAWGITWAIFFALGAIAAVPSAHSFRLAFGFSR